ncbi:MAG: BREX system ATP-binding domain-containing protein [Pyrinomonadaceae bacterium]
MNINSDRRAIRSLRIGVVPSTHVLDLTVGADSLSKALDREIESFKSGRQRSCVVNGKWGTGKSNLLSYVREYCLKRNIAVSYINLNGRSAAVNHPQRFYHRLVADLRLPGIKSKGIASLLNAMTTSEGKAIITKWGGANAYRSELAQACLAYLNLDGHRQWAVQIILGTDLSWADYAYKKDKAIRRIGDLGDFLRHLGYVGLMIQYDELETVGQLWSVVSRQSAYRMLHTLTNMKSVWSIFATTDRLSQQLSFDERSGKLR